MSNAVTSIRALLLFSLLVLSTACAQIAVEDDEEQICLPAAGRCINNDSQIEVCNDAGTAFIFTLECKDTEKCDAATCVPLAGGAGTCAAGSLRCAPDESAVQQCSANTWNDVTACAHGCNDWTCKP